MLKMDGYEEAIVGSAMVWQEQEQVEVLIYDGLRIVEILVERDGMSADEAVEFIEFNMIGGYVGPAMPIIFFPYGECDD